MPKPLLFFLVSLLAPTAAFGQPAAPQSQAVAVAAVQQQYTAAFGGLPQLYNGPEYLDYAQVYRNRTGHQFFAAPEPQNGSIYYNGHYFTGLRLAYDVVRDQVVLSQPTSPLKLRLVNEWVGYFFLNEHHFVRLVADNPASSLIRPGYYELLLEGPVQVLAKRVKYQQEKLTQGGTDVAFLPTDKLFLQKGGTYYSASGKRAVLRLLADHSPEVQQYVQAHGLRFGQAELEASTVELARYYNSLLPH